MRRLAVLILTATPLAAEIPIPGQWAGMVPEHAMGQSVAVWLGEDGTSITFLCGGRGRRLTFGADVVTGPMTDDRSEQEVNPRYLGVEGRLYPTTPLQQSYGAEWAAEQEVPFPGQIEMLQAIDRGAPIGIYRAPAGDTARAELMGTVPGRANDPGLAHVVADCGGGAPVTGQVETLQGADTSPMVGDWQLRRRGENYPFPVSVGHLRPPDGGFYGDSMGLFCDQAGTPAAYVMAGAQASEGHQITVEIRTADETFLFAAAPYSTDYIFAVSARFVAAVRAGKRLNVVSQNGATMTMDTSGGAQAADHAWGSCGPAADF